MTTSMQPSPPTTNQPTPQRIMDTIFAFQSSYALKAAIELDLFSAIAAGSSSATEIAAKCKISERACRVLCDYLTTYGFLEKAKEHYTLAPDSAAFLDRSSPMYLGSVADFLLHPHMVQRAAELPDTLRRGTIANEGYLIADNPDWTVFARAMAPMMALPAHLVAASSALDPQSEIKVLDIAAGHGEWGMAFARAFPKAQITALDWPSVLAVANERASAAGLGARFTTIAGDAFEVPFGENYDLVLIPNFVHHFSEAVNVTFLRKVHAALRPGGEVLIVDFVPNEDRVSPPFPARFALTMLSGTPEGTAYTATEYERMLAAAGFADIHVRTLLPTPQSAISGRRNS